MPRTFFASTACIKETAPLLKRIARYRDAGIGNIELGASVFVEPGDMEQVQKSDGTFLIHNYFPPPDEPFVVNLASADDAIRTRSIDLAKNALALSASLGARLYSVHAGFVTDPTGFDTTSFMFPDPTSPDDKALAFARFVLSLEEILPAAEEAGVHLLIENNVCPPNLKGKLLMEEPDGFEELFAIIAHRMLGILLDTGHLNVSAHTLGFDRMNFPRRLAGHIGAVHLHDNDGSADQHLPPVDGSWVFDALRLLPDTPVIAEAAFTTAEEVAAHVRFLEKKA